MPLTGLAPLDSSWQPARFFVINDRRLQANRVDHRSFAGFSLHNLGSGQQVAAGARRRGRRSAHRSAAGFSCSGGATMCSAAACAAEAGAPPQVFSTFNLGGAGPTSGTARAAHNTLRTLWDTSGGPMLEVHESAPTSSRKAAAARNTKQQHEHQVLSPHA